MVRQFLALLLVATVASPVLAVDYRAGYAAVDITPPVGIQIPGYPERRISVAVHDPLELVCVALNDSHHTALIFAVDNLSLPNDLCRLIKSAVANANYDKAQRPAPEAVFITSTHTHTGGAVYRSFKGLAYSLSDAELDIVIGYRDRVVAKATDAAAKAMADLTPVKQFAYAKGETKDVAFCRRYRMKDGSYQCNPRRGDPQIEEPADSPDESVRLVRIARANGKPPIAIVNFGCHPDTIGGTEISADWPGVVRRRLQKSEAHPVKCILLNGCQGDVNHVDLRVKFVKGMAVAEQVGMELVRAVRSVWKDCKPFKPGLIHAAESEVAVLYQKATSEAELAAAAKVVELVNSGRRDEIGGEGMERITRIGEALRKLRLSNNPQDGTTLTVSAVSLGQELAFCGFPGEPFTAIGRGVKSASPFAITLDCCLTNGSNGYFPSDEAYAQGGYEPRTSSFAAGTASKLVTGQLSQLNKLFSTK